MFLVLVEGFVVLIFLWCEGHEDDLQKSCNSAVMICLTSPLIN